MPISGRVVGAKHPEILKVQVPRTLPGCFALTNTEQRADVISGRYAHVYG